jgi:hypothetical protein
LHERLEGSRTAGGVLVGPLDNFMAGCAEQFGLGGDNRVFAARLAVLGMNL